MWDAFQGCDYITQNYVAFTLISSHSNVNKWSCIANQNMNITILLLYCECVMQGSKKKRLKKGAWIILWWIGGGGEEFCNWTTGGLSVSGDCSVLCIQKTSRDFLYYWDCVFGTGSSEVSNVLFCVCCLKKTLNLRSFSACLFSCNPSITKQKTTYSYRTGYILYPYFKNNFLNVFFKVQLIDSNVVKTLLLFRLLISHAPI
jgi:hypothetical protein